MMDALILRFNAPLMAFGGPSVDNYGIVQDFPAVSMLTGLLGNALGYRHEDISALNSLQGRILFAARLDRPGTLIMDYQTVDLGLNYMTKTGWTTRGKPEDRAGGTAKEKTHIRYRYYRADSICTVALTLVPPDVEPTIDAVDKALQEPVRPLYIGRKNCIPAAPIRLERISTKSLIQALKIIPLVGDRHVSAQWPAEEGIETASRVIPVIDERDWLNQIHCGERIICQGIIDIGGSYHD